MTLLLVSLAAVLVAVVAGNLIYLTVLACAVHDLRDALDALDVVIQSEPAGEFLHQRVAASNG